MVSSVVASGIPGKGVAGVVGQVDGRRNEPFGSIARHAVAARVVASARGMPSVPIVTEAAAARIAYPPVLPVEEMGIDIAASFGERGHEGQCVAHLAEDDTGSNCRRSPSKHVGGHNGDSVEVDVRVGHLETAALGVQCSFAAVGLGRMPCVGKARGVAFEQRHFERGGVAQSGVGIALQTDDRRAGQRHVCHVEHEGGRVGAKEIGCNNGERIGATDSVNYRCYTICSYYSGA